MGIKKVGVVGCGLMGSGIAQVAAACGYDTVVSEVSDELLQKGFKRIEDSLTRFVEKGTLTAEQRQQTLGRLKGTTRVEDFADCDMVIEAITENVDAKKQLLSRLDKICKPGILIGSNTSSISITEMMTALSLERQPRFLGVHGSPDEARRDYQIAHDGRGNRQ